MHHVCSCPGCDHWQGVVVSMQQAGQEVAACMICDRNHSGDITKIAAVAIAAGVSSQ